MAQPDSGNMPLDEHPSGHRPVCPACHGGVVRIPRHLSDRLLSLVVPVHRYRCARMPCNWEGTLRVPFVPSQPDARLMRRRATD